MATRVGMEGSPENGFHSATRVPNLPLALEIPFLIISRASYIKYSKVGRKELTS